MYRVMILFMLDQVEYPLTNTQITNMILEKDYTDYFSVQQTFTDLLASGLIVAESTHSNTRYRITEEGKLTLTYFEDRLSDGLKEDILTFFREHHYDLKRESSVYADYYKTPEKGYAVRCQVREGNRSILDLTLAADTKEQARCICGNWARQSEEVYALLMDLLLK